MSENEKPRPPLTDEQLNKALDNPDWTQVVMNGGPPCFFVEDDRLCFRAERWIGHLNTGNWNGSHPYVSLAAFVRAAIQRGREQREQEPRMPQRRYRYGRLVDLPASPHEIVLRGAAEEAAHDHHFDSLRIRDDDGRVFHVCLECGAREYEKAGKNV